MSNRIQNSQQGSGLHSLGLHAIRPMRIRINRCDTGHITRGLLDEVLSDVNHTVVIESINLSQLGVAKSRRKLVDIDDDVIDRLINLLSCARAVGSINLEGVNLNKDQRARLSFLTNNLKVSHLDLDQVNQHGSTW